MINTHGADAMAFCPQWIKLMDLEYHGTLLDISCGDKMLSHASHPPNKYFYITMAECYKKRAESNLSCTYYIKVKGFKKYFYQIYYIT